MKLNGPQTYVLQVPEEGAYRLLAEEVVCKFSKPASSSKYPKLYTLTDQKRLIYVGVASQSMSSRLSMGFRADGEGGYHGYKWKVLRHRLTLSVWTAEKESRPVALRELETIEAEVAFLCRLQSGQWPTYQHEIHFYPSNDAHRLAAAQIYAQAVEACP